MDVDFLRHKFDDGHIGVLTKTKFRVGIRHVQLVYMLTSNVVMGMLRGGQGIIMVAMTDRTRTNDTYIQVFNWDGRIQGTMLSSFFWGYALMMLPAEILLRRCGGKCVLTVALLTNGAILVALPTIVNQGGWIAVSNAQFIMGMTQSLLSPANQSLFHKWVPPYERNIFSWLVYGGFLTDIVEHHNVGKESLYGTLGVRVRLALGVQLGIIIASPISALMTSAPLGWELVFYSWGMVTLSAGVVWTLLTSSTPSDHPAVGDKEKEFIAEALECYKKKHLQKPWRQILLSPTFWGITCAHVGTNALFVFYLANVPAYLVSGLRIPINESGWYAMLPFISMWLTYATSAPTIEWLYRIGFVNYLLNITQFRKIITSVGALGSVVGLCVLSYTGPESSDLAIVLLTGILASVGLQYVGFLENVRDISENFSGTLLTLSGVAGSVAAAVVPFFTGLILDKDMSELKRWRIVFLSLASLCIACNIVYVTLASGDRQPWDFCQGARTKFGYYNDVNQLELEDLKIKDKIARDRNENDLLG